MRAWAHRGVDRTLSAFLFLFVKLVGWGGIPWDLVPFCTE